MRKTIGMTIIAATLVCLIATGAMAQSKPQVYAQGMILDVAEDGKSMTARITAPRKVDKIEVRFNEGRKVRYYLYMPGKEEDVKLGVWVKTYGQLAEDQSEITNVTAIQVIPEPSSYGAKGRVDGKIVSMNEEQIVLERGEKTTIARPAENVRYTLVAIATPDEIKPGVNFAMNAFDEGDYFEVGGEMRFMVDRRTEE